MSGTYFDAVATRVTCHPIDLHVIDIDKIQIDTLAGERQRDRTPNSGGGTGNQRPLSAQDFHLVRCWRPLPCRHAPKDSMHDAPERPLHCEISVPSESGAGRVWTAPD